LGQKPDGHPATTHEYIAGLRVLAILLNRQPTVQAIVIQADSPWHDGPELLDGADGVVLFLSEGAKWVSDDPERLAAFQRLARRGGGLTCLHWGMGTREVGPVAEFASMFGGCHGGPDRKYKVVSVTAKPATETLPILNGIAPFEVQDEFYYALKRPAQTPMRSILPLITVPIDDSDQSVAWAFDRADGGRSFGFSGLHFHTNWKLLEYRRLVLQGIVWTLNQPIPKDGLPVEVADSVFDLPDHSAAK
jgi:type 1 glutamine amidotransferase